MDPSRGALLAAVTAAGLGCGPDVVAPDASDVEIAFIRSHNEGGQQLRGLTPGGGDVALLPMEPPEVHLGHLRWSADGSLLAYQRLLYDGFSPSDEPIQLYLLEAGTGDERHLTEGKWGEWSPTRLELGFLRELDEASSELYVIDVESEVERRVGVGTVSEFDWAPDGERVVVSGTWPEIDSAPALYVVDVETGAPTRIDPDPPNSAGPFDSQPRWSADGSTIAFVSRGRAVEDVYSLVYVIDPDGANFELVDVGGGYYGVDGPNWSPVGRRLAYAWWYFDAVSPGDSGVGILGGAGYGGASSIEWSPDATRVAVVGRVNNGSNQAIAIVDVDESSAPMVADVQPTWSDFSPAWRAR